MSRNYKMNNQESIYFLSFATVGWIDVFTRPLYKDIVVESIEWCQINKGLELYAWCIMSNHVHLIASAGKEHNLSRIMGSLKTYTSKKLLFEIEQNKQESRREWMMYLFERAGKYNPNNDHYQFWQQHNQPIELWTSAVMKQKVNYIHYNPVEAGFCEEPHHYPYSSALDYAGGKGKLNISLIN